MPKKRAWVVSVNMGYGHQRAAYPLKDIANERIITANSDKIIPEKERKIWEKIRHTYEFLSRMKDKPFLGKLAFDMYDRLQYISPLFPFRDLSKPNFEVMYFRKLILNDGFGSSLIEYVKKEDIPFIGTHFIPVIAAHYHGLKNIYCIVTDTDVNRVWVPDNPNKSDIIYLASCRHAAVRLKEYGVDESKIITTGFPLPKENIGGINQTILKRDLGKRMPNLDPNRVYFSNHKETLRSHLGKNLSKKSKSPLTITYAVGGAGAEKETGIKIIRALREKILKGKVAVNLVAGTRLDVKCYFESTLANLELKSRLGKGIKIVFAFDKKAYFSSFNETLRTTDILWTKPSELSFYTALGLPLVIAPPVGAHEKFNREWLEHIGSGIIQENPEYVNDWLFYWLEDGRLAEAAFEGFLEAPSLGTYNIEKIIFKGTHY